MREGASKQVSVRQLTCKLLGPEMVTMGNMSRFVGFTLPSLAGLVKSPAEISSSKVNPLSMSDIIS